MRLEVEIISREAIKPSSQTPDSLRYYQLSFLDQISPAVYNSLVLFFPTEYDDRSDPDRLKQSLSDVLTHFYPLAGRIKGNIFVNCNDEGVLFVEAKVKCLVRDVIQNPIPSELTKLLPFQVNDGLANTLPLGIQLNMFGCGGVGIGICLSHKVGDALSFFTFTKAWAALTCGKNFMSPQFASVKLFPPQNISGYEPGIRMTEEQLVTRRFVFNATAIKRIQARYSTSNMKPSRVEALSAFIWNRFSEANTLNQKTSDKLYSVIHVVNLRPRMKPPLPDHSFGNLYRIAMTIPELRDDDENGRELISKMRDSIRIIDEKYVKKLRDAGQDHLNFIREKSKSIISGKMVSFSFTSLCRFPSYEADFGWGMPKWIAPGSLGFKNLVVFTDTASRDGIEAWISLKPDDMARFETDHEFVAFVQK